MGSRFLYEACDPLFRIVFLCMIAWHSSLVPLLVPLVARLMVQAVPFVPFLAILDIFGHTSPSLSSSLCLQVTARKKVSLPGNFGKDSDRGSTLEHRQE